MEFITYTQSDIHSLISFREGEVKIGQQIQVLKDVSSIESIDDTVDYLILGLPEDIGPRANCGNPGSLNSWYAFINKFVNSQSNRFMPAEKIMILGYVDFTSLQRKADLLNFKGTDLKLSRTYVEEMDNFISSLVRKIQKSGKKLIIIGGGHNNAYPIIKGTSEALGEKLNIINCDPHADFRTLEGRHSGNPFSYAKSNNYIDKYHVLGLHQIYNSEKMLDVMDSTDGISYSMFEEMMFNNVSFDNLINSGIDIVLSNYVGVELDVDGIKNFPSSAETPYGISLENACCYLNKTINKLNPVYIHIPEAAVYNEKDKNIVGKSLLYLVSTAIKSFKI